MTALSFFLGVLAGVVFATLLMLAVNSTAGSKPAFEVEHIGSIEGCDVFRFYDRGERNYFARCKDQTQVEVK